MGEVIDKESIEREEIWFDSSDGSSRIHGYIWWPKDMGPDAAAEDPWGAVEKPRGVVQVVHGMAEHLGRYGDFARFLACHGYVVCGHDHINHAGSSQRDRWGKLPLKTGKETMIKDVGRMRGIIHDKVPEGTPHFLFGHSMGSFVVRAYIAREGKGLAGAIICGTGHIPPATSSMGILACKVIAALKGEDTISPMIEGMGVGAYSKAIKNARTPVDWLSYNEDNVNTYIADDASGFSFSVGGYASLMGLTREVCDPACCVRVPPELPLLYIAGDADPVGSNGEGVRTAAKMAKEAGSREVTCTIYPNMRHEILNETEHQKVYDDVLAWIEAHVDGPLAS